MRGENLFAALRRRLDAPEGTRVRAPDDLFGGDRQDLWFRLDAALEELAESKGPWLTGSAISLADLHAAPMFAYFSMAAEGAELLASQPRLREWWQAMREHPSMAATRSPLA